MEYSATAIVEQLRIENLDEGPGNIVTFVVEKERICDSF